MGELAQTQVGDGDEVGGSSEAAAEGLPLAHRLWQGNATEGDTLSTAVTEVLRLYPVQRMILVADRGLLSMDNLALLQGLKVGSGAHARPLEYIVAVPARRYNAFAQALASVQPACQASAKEVIGEMPWPPEEDCAVSDGVQQDSPDEAAADNTPDITAPSSTAAAAGAADTAAGTVTDVHVHRVRAENPSAAVAQSTGCQSALGRPEQAKV